MSKWYRLGEHVDTSLKGITPNYVDHSDVIVLNQKCIRNNRIDFSQARFHNPEKKFSRVKILKKGDLLFNSTGQGTAGRCAFVGDLPKDKVVITDSHILILRLSDFYLAECFSFACYKEEALLQTFMDGSTGQGELDKLRLFNIEFKFPDSNERKIICEFLNDLDSKIELNNKLNLELEAMAKTIYEYWFLQFDFPDENGEPYKSSGGNMVYNEQLKREIPEGWEVGCIGDYCSSTGGFAFKSSWWSDEGVSVVKIKDIQEDNTIELSGLAKVDLSKRKIDDKFKAKPGDVLIAMTGATVGKFAIVPITDNPLYVNQRVGYFDLGEEPTRKLPYLINSLNQKYFREVVFTIASGAAQPNISNEQINKILLLIPKEELITDFNQKLSSAYKKILINQSQNHQFKDLRGWLLPMLMNGQVSVGEAEEELRMVAEENVNYGDK